MACNETFGNFEEGFMTKTVSDKEFIIKTCKIGLFDQNLWNLMCDFLILADCGKHLEKKRSHVSDHALTTANKICDILLSSHSWITDEEISRA